MERGGGLLISWAKSYLISAEGHSGVLLLPQLGRKQEIESAWAIRDDEDGHAEFRRRSGGLFGWTRFAAATKGARAGARKCSSCDSVTSFGSTPNAFEG